MDTYELNVKAVELRDRKPFGPRYAWQTGECDEVYLNVTAQDNDGNTVWFSAGAIERTVTCPVGCPVAVVTYEKGNAWLEPPTAYAVEANMSVRPGGGQFEPQVRPGDRITVREKIKKQYHSGYSLSHVRLISQ